MNKPKSFKHIVLSGGGGILLTQIGALYECIQSNILNIQRIESIYGTSAGSISAFIMSLGLEREVIMDYFIERPWHKLFEPLSMNILNIYSNKGMYNKSLFVDMLSPLFKFKNISCDITLKEYFNISSITLYLYSVKLETLEEVEISHHSHPELKLLDAIYMSCCFPFMFEPFWYNDTFYIDGGATLNYPILNCIKRNEQDISCILGIPLIKQNSKDDIARKFEKDMDIVSYGYNFIHGLVNKINNQCRDKYLTEMKKEHEEQYQDYLKNVNEIIIPLHNKKTISYDFIHKIEKRKEFVELGIEHAKLFIKYYLKT